MVNILFYYGSDKDIGVEPPDFILELVLDGVSRVVLVQSPSLLCVHVVFDVKACPSIQGSKVIFLVFHDVVPVVFNHRSFDIGINF